MTFSDSPRQVTIATDLNEVRRVQQEVEEALLRAEYGNRDVFCAKLALEEALVNAVKHGNQNDPSKQITVEYEIDSAQFLIRVTDQGPGFDPHAVPDPTAPENLERPCGRGLLLIRSFMSAVEYNSAGNSILMCKQRTPESPEESPSAPATHG